MEAAGAELLLDDERLRISLTRGDGELAVVSFSGVRQGLGGIQLQAFRQSLARSLGGQASVLHVADKACSWYGDGLDARVADRVGELLARIGAGRVATLGNSMGGFGAVVFARRLAGCDRALAFSPQSSVDRRVAPFEDRWPQWVDRVGGWSEPDAAATLGQGLRYHLVFGANDPLDIQHAARFQARATPLTEVRLVPGAGHGVAAHLRDRGELYPLLRRLLLAAPVAPQALACGSLGSDTPADPSPSCAG